MPKKIIIQPGVYIMIVFLALVGVFFGIRYLKSTGSLGKISNTIAPKKETVYGVTVTPIKLDGKKPIIVALNTWVGFAPGVYFNGGFEPTQSSRFYTEFGVPVQFVSMNNFDDSRNAWKNDKVDIICNTVDVLPTEIPSFMEFKPKVFIQIDWSRGGDKMVVRPGINTIADLRGKKIALAISSPSQTLIINALEAGGLEYDEIKDNIVTMPTALDAAAAYKAGQVDAALVWAPDDEDCIAAIPGSKVLISTTEARNAISDIFYAKEDFIKSHRTEITAFVQGWLKAAAEINRSPEAKIKAQKLMANCFNVPEALMNLDFARFTTYGDNVNFFSLSPGDCECVKGEDLYNKMARAFYKIGLAPASVPAWRDISDISILQSLKPSFTGPENDPEESITFSKPVENLKTVEAIATKRVTINFATNQSVLSDDAKYRIDQEFSGIAKRMSGFYVRIEGNTDNTGSDAVNIPLSKKRAQAVADYLVATYGFDVNRFIIVGNGSKNPVAPNTTESGRADNRRTDFELVN